jgi:hypothetical protein
MSIDTKTNISDKPIFLGYVEYDAAQMGGGKANHYVSLVPITVDNQSSTMPGMKFAEIYICIFMIYIGPRLNHYFLFSDRYVGLAI